MKHSASAFTLIEILVVISLMGILAVVSFVYLRSARDKAHMAGGKSFEGLIRRAYSGNLVGEWMLDSVDGGLTHDTSGFDYDGTVNGTSISTDCVHGTCIEFNGVSDYINLGNVFPFTSSFTISSWVNTSESKSNNYVISKMRGAGKRDWSLKIEYDQALLQITGNGTDVYHRYSNSFSSVDRWHYIVGVFDADNKRLDIYIDGALENRHLFSPDGPIDPSELPTSMTTSGNDVYMGSREGTYNMNGKMDMVRIYNVAISSNEVAQLYQAQRRLLASH